MKRENCPHTECNGPRVREPYTTNFVNCHCLAADSSFNLYGHSERPEVGVMLYEIAEIDSFNKSDATQVKGFVTQEIDRYREPLASLSLPLNMEIRFLEIIYSDTDQLLTHKDDDVFMACNLRTLRGLISTLALAYVDQDCPDFMTIITASEQALAVTADPQADKIGPLLELKDIISARLLEISPNLQNYHAEKNQTN